jgi:hypothetical protein
MASSTVFAAENEKPTTPTSDAHLRGLELALRPTVGGAGNDSPVTIADNDAPIALRPGSGAFKWAAGVGAQIGWRFHPFVSAGLRFDYSRISTDVQPVNDTKGLSREAMGGGLYTRIYPLAMNERFRRHIDPWIGGGVGYARDVVSFEFPDKSNTLDVRAERHAIAVPIGIGFDYRATEWLSVGPSFEYVLMNPVAGCVDVSMGSVSQKTCTDDSSGKLVASTVGAWNVGVMLRVTPF